jgi:hypothetical protein
LLKDNFKNITESQDFFCNYYDQGLFIGSTPQGQNLIAMCCYQNKKIIDVVEFDHPYLQDLRTEAKNKVPAVCDPACKSSKYHNERLRTRLEQYWTDSGVEIKKLHLEQSLICNLTCISCCSRYSSAWSKDYKIFDPHAHTVQLKKYPDRVWKNLNFSSLEHVHFTGGEPLLNFDNFLILEHLASIGRLNQVTLTYNTNGTVRVSNKLVELWKQAKWVRLHFSLDGSGSTFEYTRYPANWQQVQENIQWYRQLPDTCILIEVNAIVGIHNVFNLDDFYQWWKQNCQTGNQGDNSYIFVKAIAPSSYGGRVLSLTHMPKQFEQHAQDMLQSLSDLPGASDLISLVGQQSDMQWLEYFEKLDNLRGTNWRASLTGPIITI